MSQHGGSDSKGKKEHRRHTRVVVNQEFRCIEDYIAEYVTNISHGGVFIRSKNPLPVGTRVDLQFSVVLDDIEQVRGE
ncbi:MAG: PilZ domain-containing protein, partial [Persicimonas sp.]